MTGQPDHGQGHAIHRLTLSRVLDGVEFLCPACHRDVPSADGVVLTVFVAFAGWIILSDSGPNGDQLDDLYITLGEGPRIDVATSGKPVTAADLTTAQAHATWPRFTAQALTNGIRAIFAVPVPLEEQPPGVLSVYRATAGPLSANDRHQIDRYARTAATLLRAAIRVNGVGAASMPLPTHAGEVQQAVGAVMQHATTDAVTALHRLRASAHHSRRPMRDVVAEARSGRLPFHPTAPV